MAGKRKGTEDERHLWPEMLRVIREVAPDWVVGENVFGLTNWDGGLVFEQVQADLEAEGYEVQPYVLPACAVNAPHRRDRIWLVAHSTNERLQGHGRFHSTFREMQITTYYKSGASADTNKERLSGERKPAELGRNFRFSQRNAQENGSTWDNFPTQPPLRGRDDGISSRLVGITVSKHRNESIKAYGNAIVPQVAFQIFKAIEQYHA